MDGTVIVQEERFRGCVDGLVKSYIHMRLLLDSLLVTA